MKSNMLIMLLLAPVLLSCASMKGKPRIVIMQHPQTMEFVNCEVDHWITEKSFAENDACVEKYQKLGYVIWGSQ